MRHFFYTNSEGRLLGTTIKHGGYSDDHDLSDPGCSHPDVIRLLKHAATVEGFDRFVEYVCPCSSSDVDCPCAHNKVIEFYAEGSVLRPKSALLVLIDGVDIGPVSASPVVRTPGATVVLKLAADVPDGSQIVLQMGGKASIMADGLTLTFAGGETPEVNLTAPALGMTGRVIGIGSKFVRQFSAQLKGGA